MKNYLKNYTNKLLQDLRKNITLIFIENIWGAHLADM